MRLNEFGKMTQQCWLEIPDHFPQTQLDEYIIMANDIHGIIILNDIDNPKKWETDKKLYLISPLFF